MGIDGGGSTVRVVIVTPDLAVHGQSLGPTANPSVVGTEVAMAPIQTAIRAALGDAALSAWQIAAAGIGIAGSAVSHSEAWLRAVIGPNLSEARIIPSSDDEIALAVIAISMALVSEITAALVRLGKTPERIFVSPNIKEVDPGNNLQVFRDYMNFEKTL